MKVRLTVSKNLLRKWISGTRNPDGKKSRGILSSQGQRDKKHRLVAKHELHFLKISSSIGQKTQ